MRKEKCDLPDGPGFRTRLTRANREELGSIVGLARSLGGAERLGNNIGTPKFVSNLAGVTFCNVEGRIMVRAQTIIISTWKVGPESRSIDHRGDQHASSG